MKSGLWILLLFFIENMTHLLFPDQAFPLVLSAVIFFALRQSTGAGALIGLWGGLLLELFKVGPIGFAVLPMAAVGAVSSFMSSKIFRESFLAQVVMPAGAFYFFLAVNVGSLWEKTFLFKILLAALLSPVIFHFLKKTVESSPARRNASWLL